MKTFNKNMVIVEFNIHEKKKLKKILLSFTSQHINKLEVDLQAIQMKNIAVGLDGIKGYF